jgi:hypothetical protein
MTRPLIALLLALSASPAVAEGPGTRIRSSSQLPQPPIVQRAPDACARLQGAQRERCIRDERRRTAAGTTRGGSFGASAPR